MKRTFQLAIVTAVLLAGCGQDSLEKKIQDSVPDPDSTKFRNRLNYGERACVEVNTKNSFGGYTGFMPYTAKATGKDQWEIESQKARCDVETLRNADEAAKRPPTREEIMLKEADEEIFGILHRRGFVPDSVNEVDRITNPECRGAVHYMHSFVKSMADDRSEILQDMNREKYQKHIVWFKVGRCSVTPEFGAQLKRMNLN